MINFEATKEILSIKEPVELQPDKMAKQIQVLFLDGDNVHELPEHVVSFKNRLEAIFVQMGINIIKEEDAYYEVSLLKRLQRFLRILVNNLLYNFEIFYKKEDERRILIPLSVIYNTFKTRRFRSGIHIFVLGEHKTGNLPMEKTANFRTSSIVNILDWPENITPESSFQEHFHTAMDFFTHHMTNIVLGVSEKHWLVYNFNASHPIYDFTDEEIKKHVLDALIPKLVAPIRPVVFDDFKIRETKFDPYDSHHKQAVDDLVNNSVKLEETSLYPKGKKISELPFRNQYYEWIGKLHLDNRNGMSYGFLARQLPITPEEVTEVTTEESKDFWYEDGKLFITLNIGEKKYSMRVPEVWVLTQRSGCDKTNMDVEKDLIKMGLVDGELFLQPTKGQVYSRHTKTSFDTKVILAHAVGNAIITSLLAYRDPQHPYVDNAIKNGFSITHWHGYIEERIVPEGWFVHGWHNPHVSCSSPHSAIYALQGKMGVFEYAQQESKPFNGDIHIEPHHGTNMIHSSIQDFFDFVVNNRESIELGNKYHK